MGYLIAMNFNMLVEEERKKERRKKLFIFFLVNITRKRDETYVTHDTKDTFDLSPLYSCYSS